MRSAGSQLNKNFGNAILQRFLWRMRRNCINKYTRRPIYMQPAELPFSTWKAIVIESAYWYSLESLWLFSDSCCYLETLNVNIESLLGICLIMSMSVITVKKENISLEIIFWRCLWCRFVYYKIIVFLPNQNHRNEFPLQIFGL